MYLSISLSGNNVCYTENILTQKQLWLYSVEQSTVDLNGEKT